jgi:ABC-2 type transport system permease protein
MTSIRLVAHQFRYDLRSLRRNRQAVVTTLLLPLLLLVLFVSVGGHDSTVVQDGRSVKAIVFFAPGLIAMAIVAAAFANLLVDLVVQRESGVLKRWRATPVPAWVLIAGRTATALAVAAMTSFVLLAVAGNRYDLRVTARELVTVAACIVAGTITFSALSYAVAPSVRSSSAIQPIVQLVLLPLYLISGVFLPDSKNASWLNDLGVALPLEHVTHGLHRAFGPEQASFGLTATDALVLAAWTIGALAIALTRFAWLPHDRSADSSGRATLVRRLVRATRADATPG